MRRLIATVRQPTDNLSQVIDRDDRFSHSADIVDFAFVTGAVTPGLSVVQGVAGINMADLSLVAAVEDEVRPEGGDCAEFFILPGDLEVEGVGVVPGVDYAEEPLISDREGVLIEDCQLNDVTFALYLALGLGPAAVVEHDVTA